MIPTAPERKRDILLLHQKRTVHKNINVFEDLPTLQLLIGVSAVQPDIFLRHLPPDLFQQRKERLFVFRLTWFTAEYGNALYPRGTQGFDDLIFSFFCEGLSIAEIPCLRVVTALSVIPASTDEQRHTDTVTVGDVIFIQTAVIHRCITRSLISAVRP